ncbi:MAG: hypothetical protein LUQ25_06905 [Methanoregulaceae archaeon]|nr:hypothetical protein [Methanoregulaceae archaeon]
MVFEWDPVTFTNLVLCVLIFALGYLGYRKTGNLLPIYVGVAFGLFGVSHFLTLAGFKVLLTIPLILIRTAAYLLVIVALYKYWQENILNREAKQAWIDFYKEETLEVGDQVPPSPEK